MNYRSLLHLYRYIYSTEPPQDVLQRVVVCFPAAYKKPIPFSFTDTLYQFKQRQQQDVHVEWSLTMQPNSGDYILVSFSVLSLKAYFQEYYFFTSWSIFANPIRSCWRDLFSGEVPHLRSKRGATWWNKMVFLTRRPLVRGVVVSCNTTRPV